LQVAVLAMLQVQVLAVLVRAVLVVCVAQLEQQVAVEV
jgi:hypothetical protein